MSSRIILLIRRSREYYLNGVIKLPNMGKDDESDFWRDYHKKSVRGIKWWNELFKTPFLEFKRRLAHIASRYYTHASYDCVLQYLDWQHIAAIEKLSDSWIFPMDEDDWPHPELPNILRKANLRNYDYVLWDVYRIQQPQAPRRENGAMAVQCIKADIDYYDNNIVISNSYAVRPTGQQAHIAYHGRVDNTLRNKNTRIKYIKRPLGIKVDNPSSLSFLVNCEHKEMLETNTRRFIDDIGASLRVPPIFQGGFDALKEEMDKL